MRGAAAFLGGTKNFEVKPKTKAHPLEKEGHSKATPQNEIDICLNCKRRGCNGSPSCVWLKMQLNIKSK